MELTIEEVRLMLGDREIKLYNQAKEIIKLRLQIAELAQQLAGIKPIEKSPAEVLHIREQEHG